MSFFSIIALVFFSTTAGYSNDTIYIASLNVTGADASTFPTGVYTGGYYQTFPTGTEGFDVSFDNAYIPNGFSLQSGWAGSARLTYKQLDANPQSNASFSAGDRVTEHNDFNPGVFSYQSGDVYSTFGRGLYSLNAGTVAGHNWEYTFDFSTLANGYLPAGTYLAVTDVDGTATNGESLLAAAVISGGSGPWLDFFDEAQSDPAPGNGLATYNASNNTYFWDGPNNNSAADVNVYVTTQNLTSLTLTMTHGNSGGSIGFKVTAPVNPPDTIKLASLNVTGADVSTYPTGNYTGGYWQTFPTGAEGFDVSFENGFLPAGYNVKPGWGGSARLNYNQLDANPQSNAGFSAGDRITEHNDFNPGDFAYASGDVYNTYGRGIYYMNGGTIAGHDWEYTFDFSTLENGYLPAGTYLAVTDVDGIATNGESLLASAVLNGGSGAWLIFHDEAQSAPAPGNGLATYNASNNTYFWDGPNNNSAADVNVYLTTQDLTSLTIRTTTGTSGGSVGLKITAPIELACVAGVELSSNSFETGLEGWTDGGSDCKRVYSTSRSFDGDYSVRIRDNSGASSSMTSGSYDLTSHDAVDISFHFYPNSMENGEDFWLRYNDGSGWQTVATYARGTDFNNNAFYSASVTLDAASYNLTSNAQFRFQCDASGNADRIYIDQVSVTGRCNAAANWLSGPSQSLVELSTPISNLNRNASDELEDDQSTIKLSPNPTEHLLNLWVHPSITIQSVSIFTINGALVRQVKANGGFETIDVSQLTTGTYVISIKTTDSVISKKFVKI